MGPFAERGPRPTSPATPPARDLGYPGRPGRRGALDPQLAGELPWEDLPRALAQLRARTVPGKLVLTLGG